MHSLFVYFRSGKLEKVDLLSALRFLEREGVRLDVRIEIPVRKLDCDAGFVCQGLIDDLKCLDSRARTTCNPQLPLCTFFRESKLMDCCVKHLYLSDNVAGYEIRSQRFVRVTSEEIFYRQVQMTFFELIKHAVDGLCRCGHRVELGFRCIKHNLPAVIEQLHILSASLEINSQLVRAGDGYIAVGKVRDDLTIASQELSHTSGLKRERFRVANRIGDGLQHLKGEWIDVFL